MRRGWGVAGVLTLVAVPSVPVAATGVSLVLERVHEGGEVGKQVRTGDVQRFRVRLNGMAKGARVAVAASPATALTEVSCPPLLDPRPTAGADGLGAATPAGVVGQASAGPAGAAAPGLAGQGAASAGLTGQGTASVGLSGQGSASAEAVGAGEGGGAAGRLARRALRVVGDPAAPGAVPPGAGVCRLGKVAGERAVDVTVKAPAGAWEVVLAAVARLRGTGDGPTILSRSTAVQVGGTRITGERATFSGRAHRLPPPKRDGLDQRAHTSPLASPAPTPTPARPSTRPPAGAGAAPTVGASPIAGTRPSPGATPSARATARVQGPGSAARADRTARGHRTVRAGRAASATPAAGAGGPAAGAGSAASATPPASGVLAASPAPAASAAVAAGGVPALPPFPPVTPIVPVTSVTPGVPGPGVPSGGVPQALPSAAVSLPAGTRLLASFQAEGPGGAAPLPWEMVSAAKHVHPVRYVSPIDGPQALPMVAGAIGVLLGGLWIVVTVQRGRNRRNVL
ncbi:hypothetical protein AB0C28_35885 [Nonomuraea sp. NPDC048892]|uniref:hypothetical protein n=1 Tax=Nonomuraea sp. NPDC048892 TaxID=3154624 RepID=UPI003410C642